LLYNVSIMNEAELKTSIKQRVVIGLIAVVMLGSVIAGYVAIVANGGSKSTNTEITDEKAQEYYAAYSAKLEEFKTASASDFAKFSGQLGAVAAYDETAANSNGVATKELVVGDGRELTSGDTNYLAYYVGWCADGTIFDSSLDDTDNPTSFTNALDASQGMIEGWNEGVVGMKLGGIRRITIPGEKAYGSSREICGGYDKPLRFLAMVVANEEPFSTVVNELETAYMKVQYANYGLDYEAVMAQ